jgi:hypothetical protein
MNNHVGDSVAQEAGNRIEDNFCYGVEVSGSGSQNNIIANNMIGDIGHPNRQGGVHLTSNSHDNRVIHWFAGANLIFYNTGPGVFIDGGSHDNFIGDNTIGWNTGNGIQLSGVNTTGNVISRTLIAVNGLDGINERNNAGGNSWSEVAIIGNGGLGIDLFGGNDSTNNPDEPLPVVDSAVVSGPNIVVQGQVAPPAPLTNGTVELYNVAVDASGYGEGSHYIGTATVNVFGHWTLIYPGASVGCYTGFETTHSIIISIPPNSGEFGPSSCRTLLPVIRR